MGGSGSVAVLDRISANGADFTPAGMTRALARATFCHDGVMWLLDHGALPDGVSLGGLYREGDWEAFEAAVKRLVQTGNPVPEQSHSKAPLCEAARRRVEDCDSRGLAPRLHRPQLF